MQKSIAGSLRLGFGALVVFLVLAAMVRLALSEHVASEFVRTAHEIEAAREANTDILQALTDVETGVRGYQLTRDRTFLEPADRGRAAFPKAMAQALAHAPDDRARDLLNAERASAITWLDEFVVPLMAKPPEQLPSQPGISGVGKGLFDKIRVANVAVRAALDASKRAAFDGLRRANVTAEAMAAGLSLATTLCVVLLGRRTVRPLENIATTLTRLGQGDRSARTPETGPVEVRQVIRGLNEVCDESDRLRAGEQRRMHMQALGHEIGSRVRRSLEQNAVLDEVVEALGNALEVDRAFIQLLRGGDLGGIERQWHRPGVPPLTTDIPPVLIGELPSLAQAPGASMRVCDDVAGDHTLDQRFVTLTGAGAYVQRTFGFDDQVYGVVALVRVGAPRRWLLDELALVDAVSGDLGRAFEHVRLYEHERDIADRLRAVDEQKTDFIATVSHELRTPLTSVLGYLEVLTSGDQGPIPDRQLKSLRIIERNAERLGEMVGDLLTLSRIESNTFNLAFSPVRVADIVEATVAALGPVAAGVGLELRTHASPDLWVSGDRHQLQRVLVNLLGNAIKFTRPGGSISIEARAGAQPRGRDGVRITVSDTGIGIPEAEQQNLFKPFQRGTNAVATATQGPGLGLAVVRSIVEQHQGAVELVSQPGRGTDVTIVLTRSAPVVDDTSAGPVASPAVDSPVAGGV